MGYREGRVPIGHSTRIAVLNDCRATNSRRGFYPRQLSTKKAPLEAPFLCATAVLGEFERELIRTLTSEGRARAKANGVHMGRPPKLTPHQRREALKRRDAGESLTDIARTYGVSHTTIARL